MPSLLKLLLLLAFSLSALSCESEKKSSIEDRDAEGNYFSDSSAKESLSTLQNELNRGETELLKKFAVDPIPWQKWDPSILEKARVRQAPIFLYVASGLSENSRSIAVEISERKSVRKTLMDNSVCSVADIQINPELGILAHRLASEINQPTSFPTLLWMSHEGSPIAWLPISKTSGRKLEIVINSSAAMVADIWENESHYAVSNSRMDNQQRQERIDSPFIPKNKRSDTETSPSREEVFRVGTRSISSLYSEIDQNIDHTGGLLPTSTLNLLSLGSIHRGFTPQIRKKCVRAITEISDKLIHEALKDQLDGSYFYARRNIDWSLPIFSKNLESQCSLALLYLTGGSIISNQTMIDEGRQLLEIIKNDWLSTPRSYIAPVSNPDREGSFIVDEDTLKKVLTEEEQKLASIAYSLKPDGNIPDSVDPLGIFFQKNSLRRNLPLPDIAKKTGTPEEQVQQQLEQIRQKLLAHRNKVTKFLTSSLIDAGTFSRVVRAQLAGARVLKDDKLLAEALKNGALLKKNYFNATDGLHLFPIDSEKCVARSRDYSLCALAALDLYQTTLDPQWLKWSIALMDEALLKLSREGFPLLELPESESIIPLKVHNRSMIFSDSSVGISHDIFLQLATLTGEERFQKMADVVAKDLAALAIRAPINHSDFLISCARGEAPLVTVLQGADSADGNTLLKTLNSPNFLPFISIRGDQATAGLATLPDLPPLIGNASVALFLGETLLGTAANSEDLNLLLTRKISEKE